MASLMSCRAQSRHPVAIPSDNFDGVLRLRFALRMTARFIAVLSAIIFAARVAAQSAVDVVRPEDQQKARRAVVKEQETRAKQTSIIEFRGEQAFKDKELRVALKEEITTIEDFGLS